MFEAINRAGCGRTGKLSGEGWTLLTPTILSLDTDRFPAPEHAEATLRSSDGGISVKAGGTEAFALPAYSGLSFTHGTADAPEIRGRAYIIRAGSDIEEIAAMMGKADLFVLENSIELYNNTKKFIDTVVAAREAIGYQAALYLPGVALPNNMALLAYLGADLLDTARVALLSGQGEFLTRDGTGEPEDFCHCTACAGGGGRYLHNVLEMHAEMLLVRRKLARGGIREHAEYRAKTSSGLVEMLRHLDMRHFAYQERRFPVVSGNFAATTRLALGRPDIVRFRNRITERYVKPPTPDVLVLLPCSARKPYSSSRSHGLFARAISDSGAAPRVHEVIVTSPLGLVPRELELCYPAQHYDIPVTGHWFEDEKVMINNLLKKYLENNKYIHIINHLGDGLLDLDAENTVTGAPASEESLKNLMRALAAISGSGKGWKGRASEEIASMTRFQFGKPAGEIFSGCAMAGRFPQVRVMREKSQLATVSGSNGMLVPTVEGARLLAEKDIHTVHMSDFQLVGNLFAVGVESASQDIRAGDEVVIVRNGELRASGTARMSGEEMAQSDRGEAVRVRHKARG